MATFGSSSSRLFVSRLLRTRLTTSASSVPRHTTATTLLSIRSNSTTNAIVDDPGQLVSGLTKDQVEASPEIAEFLRSNFAAEGDDDDNNKEGSSIPLEILKEYGYDESDFAPMEENQYGEPRVDKGLGSAEQQALNIRKLSTFLRQEEGTRDCDLLRDDFIIPGIMYGSDPTRGVFSRDKSTRILVKTPWGVLQREVDRFHRHFESRVYDLTVYEDESDTEGTVHRVLPRDVQRHPVQGKLYCANFLRYHAGRPIKIPIVYINQEESPALKRDGYIIPVNKFVECMVEEGVPIPEALELECTGLQLKDVIRLDRLIFPDGVKPSKRVNKATFVIGPVAGGRGGALEDDETTDAKAAA
jgi:large subunit ribosomal protein L25